MEAAKKGASEHMCEQIRQNLSEGWLLLDTDGVITASDPVLEALLGYPGATLCGQPYQALAPAAQPLPPPAGEPRHYQAHLRHRDGHSVPVSITVAPLAANSGDKTLVSIMSTIELQRLNEALSHTQRLAGIGTLTASVAHELTNPLSIITMTCSNLLHEARDDSLSREQLLRYVELIEQSAFRGARIIEVLRNYVYSAEPQIAVTDVNMIVRDSLTLLEQQFLKQANVRIAVEVPAQLKTVVCDHNRITQVLVNLLTNARDALQPDGGTIEVKFWPLPAEAGGNGRHANGGGQTATEQFAFSVHDHGHGIAPEAMPRLFTPFFTTKPSGQGTGLGLYIAQGIVRQHNGRIWAENNPNGGATFTVVLPQRQ